MIIEVIFYTEETIPTTITGEITTTLPSTTTATTMAHIHKINTAKPETTSTNTGDKTSASKTFPQTISGTTTSGEQDGESIEKAKEKEGEEREIKTSSAYFL